MTRDEAFKKLQDSYVGRDFRLLREQGDREFVDRAIALGLLKLESQLPIDQRINDALVPMLGSALVQGLLVRLERAGLRIVDAKGG